MAAYARVHDIEFPLLKDLGNAVADRLGAQRTPEVFVLDQNASVRYRGRIDDQYGFQTRHRLLRGPKSRAATWPRRSTSCWPASPSASRRPRRPAA